MSQPVLSFEEWIALNPELAGERCEDCKGKGKVECSGCFGNGKNDCDACDGMGEFDGAYGALIECEYCGGFGYGECEYCDGTGKEPCQFCDGQGTLASVRYAAQLATDRKRLERWQAMAAMP